MPPISILPSAKPHPFAGQNIKAFENILKTIGQAETLRRQRLLQSDVLKVISGGGDPQQMMSDIANVLTSQMQPNYSSGFPGLAQRIGGLFATPTMGLEDVLSGEMMKSAMRPTRTPTGKTLKGEKFHWQQDPVSGEWEKTPVPATSTAEKPLTPSSLDSYSKRMDAFIKKAKRFAPGWKNYSKERLLKSWEKFKKTAAFDKLKDIPKQQLSAMWNSKIEALGNEADWDQLDVKPQGVDFTNDFAIREQHLQSAPDIALDPYWSQLSDKQKTDIWKRFQKEGPAAIDDIMEMIKNAGS